MTEARYLKAMREWVPVGAALIDYWRRDELADLGLFRLEHGRMDASITAYYVLVRAWQASPDSKVMVSVDEPEYKVRVNADDLALSQIKLKYGWLSEGEQVTETIRLVLTGTAIKVATIRTELYKWLMGRSVGVRVEMPSQAQREPSEAIHMPGGDD